MKQIIYIHKFKTRLGWFHLASTEKGLAVIDFFDSNGFEREVKKRFGEFEKKLGGSINQKAEKEIKSYLDGKLTKFTIKLDVDGTPFQQKAMRKIGSIPYGKTMTYGEIARLLGNPGAARAVGSVNARNPLPIIIPCHRVLAVNGLGGYAGGLDLKRFLLDLEKAAY